MLSVDRLVSRERRVGPVGARLLTLYKFYQLDSNELGGEREALALFIEETLSIRKKSFPNNKWNF